MDKSAEYSPVTIEGGGRGYYPTGGTSNFAMMEGLLLGLLFGRGFGGFGNSDCSRRGDEVTRGDLFGVQATLNEGTKDAFRDWNLNSNVKDVGNRLDILAASQRSSAERSNDMMCAGFERTRDGQFALLAKMGDGFCDTKDAICASTQRIVDVVKDDGERTRALISANILEEKNDEIQRLRLAAIADKADRESEKNFVFLNNKLDSQIGGLQTNVVAIGNSVNTAINSFNNRLDGFERRGSDVQINANTTLANQNLQQVGANSAEQTQLLRQLLAALQK